MPEMSQANKESLNRFVSEYNELPWYKRIFYPRTLGAALKKYHENPSLGSAFTVCDAFQNKTRAIQRWFFSSISFFSSSEFAGALRELNGADFLTGDSAQANFNAVAGHQKPGDVAWALDTLNRSGLLTRDAAQANFNAVAGHQNPGNVVLALDTLNRAGLLTGDAAQANRDAVAGHQKPRDVADALGILNRAGLLTGDAAETNRNTVAGHQNPQGVANALDTLNTAGLLTGDTARANRNAVVGHQDPYSVARALDTLNRADLLTGDAAQANFNAVREHRVPDVIADLLIKLNTADLLTRPNRHAVVEHAMPLSFYHIIKILNERNLLTQDSFNRMIPHTDILFDSFTTSRIWAQIPDGVFTQEHFNEIIAICNNNQETAPIRRQRLITCVNQIIGVVAPQPGAAPAFNPGQSTHTASVHKSVSESAIRLRTLYNDNIMGHQLERVIKDISTWLTEVPGDSLQIMAAKRCFTRLTAVDYTFTDPESLVSTRQLLALAWIAIHDESQWHPGATLDDAKALLIEGLYEIQRGYNISKENVDNNAPNDRSICPAGTFNKIMEKLHGVHSSVKIDYITMDGASLKLQAVVREEAMSYLKSLLATEEGRQQLEKIVGKMKEQNDYGVEAIFPKIKTTVANRLFDEFGVLFSEGKESDYFSGFIKQGKYILLSVKDVLALLNPSAPKVSANGFFGGGASAGGGADDTNKPAASPSL